MSAKVCKKITPEVKVSNCKEYNTTVIPAVPAAGQNVVLTCTLCTEKYWLNAGACTLRTKKKVSHCTGYLVNEDRC